MRHDPVRGVVKRHGAGDAVSTMAVAPSTLCELELGQWKQGGGDWEYHFGHYSSNQDDEANSTLSREEV